MGWCSSQHRHLIGVMGTAAYRDFADASKLVPLVWARGTFWTQKQTVRQPAFAVGGSPRHAYATRSFSVGHAGQAAGRW